MKIWFDEAFDGYTWPGPLANKKASIDEVWCGPKGLLGILEVHLGLAGPVESDTLRAASLIPRIRGTSGFWSESAVVDPFAVARTLLNWRDTLCLAGWSGEKVSTRLHELANVTSDLAKGMPDRLLAVNHALRLRRTNISCIYILESRDTLPLLWQRTLEALEYCGVKVLPWSVTVQSAKGDLAGCRLPNFKPQKDGSIQLLRPQGPLAAAEEVAAWLASTNWKDTIIINADPILDAALHRFNLPTTGVKSNLATNALLEILPLAISCGWAPSDPQRMIELLTLPISPIPVSIARGLAEALQEQPAVDSDKWRSALSDGLDSIEDDDQRATLKNRLHVLLTPTQSSGMYDSNELNRRLTVLQQWLRGRIHNDTSDLPQWQAAIDQCATFGRLVEVSGIEKFSLPQLQHLLQDATCTSDGLTMHVDKAYIHPVASPGSITATVPQVIWWDFCRSSVPKLHALPLTLQEKQALAKCDVRLPSPALQAETLGNRWRRPLLHASRAVLLVCPLYGHDGEVQHPHPLWDEIAARIAPGNSISVLEVEKPLFKAKPGQQAVLPIAVTNATDRMDAAQEQLCGTSNN